MISPTSSSSLRNFNNVNDDRSKSFGALKIARQIGNLSLGPFTTLKNGLYSVTKICSSSKKNLSIKEAVSNIFHPLACYNNEKYESFFNGMGFEDF